MYNFAEAECALTQDICSKSKVHFGAYSFQSNIFS